MAVEFEERRFEIDVTGQRLPGVDGEREEDDEREKPARLSPRAEEKEKGGDKRVEEENAGEKGEKLVVSSLKKKTRIQRRRTRRTRRTRRARKRRRKRL